MEVECTININIANPQGTLKEAEDLGDILMGEFHNAYKNLTLKTFFLMETQKTLGSSHPSTSGTRPLNGNLLITAPRTRRSKFRKL